MKPLCRILLLFFSVAAIISCDTANSIDPPVQSYFLKYYGNDGEQEGVDVLLDSQGFFYLLGNSVSEVSLTGARNGNGKQLYLVKADAEGKVVWAKTFGGKTDEEARDMEFTSDGRLAIVGNVVIGAGDRDLFLLTTDQDGNLLDSAIYGFKNYDEDARSITQINSGFIVAGSTTNPTLKPTGSGPSTTDSFDAMQLRFFDTLDPDTVTWRRANGTALADVAIKIYQVTPSANSPSSFYVFGYSNKPNLGDNNDDFNFWYFGLGVDGEPNGQDWTLGSPVDAEKLSAVGTSPLVSGDGYILTGTTRGASGLDDIYVAKIRKTLSFSTQDIQFSKPLNALLDQLKVEKVAVYPSAFSGYLILANEITQGNNNFYLTKITNDGSLAWGANPYLIFGGTKDDMIGSVLELPDGKIILFGTIGVGDDGQDKMALIKLNTEGKFYE